MSNYSIRKIPDPSYIFKNQGSSKGVFILAIQFYVTNIEYIFQLSCNFMKQTHSCDQM